MVQRLVILGRSTRAIQLAGDGVSHAGQLLLLLLEVLGGSSGGVVLEPVESLLDGVQDGLLVVLVDLTAEAVLVADLALPTIPFEPRNCLASETESQAGSQGSGGAGFRK